MNLRVITIAIAASILLSSCDVLSKNVATTGPARYKSEVSSLLLNIKNEIDQNGEVSDTNHSKMDALMEKWSGEMSGKGSFHKLQDVNNAMDKAKAEPANAFRELQQANLAISQTLEVLKTEVR